ncbi:aldose 1-epimerase family protein [Arthrobacter sp. NPDC058192]|uniref:aldose 1-epimerase family protein n=1 Tax=Arthrobacter sp. NPDC058192 TaxID=3346372 RepID=UPI0036EEC2D9
MNEYEIRAGGYAAVITPRGAALRELLHRGRDLIVPSPAGGPVPDYRGIIAAPWPNRIADGTYSFDGEMHRLPINEPERKTSLHGLAFALDWTLNEQDGGSLTLVCTVGPAAGYPFELELQAQYVLDGNGLHFSVTASNVGGATAPYGVCPHPYLVAGPAPLDDWILEIPAGAFLEVTPDRLLPKEIRAVEGHKFDFRAARAIGAIEIDHAFTDIAFDGDGQARVLVRDPGGTGVGLAWDRKCRWLQIHTADKQPPAPNRLGLAVEPMTCPPDAFNSDQDLVELKPGTSHQASWRIFAA